MDTVALDDFWLTLLSSEEFVPTLASSISFEYLIPSSLLPSKNANPLAPQVADIKIFSSVVSKFFSQNKYACQQTLTCCRVLDIQKQLHDQ